MKSVTIRLEEEYQVEIVQTVMDEQGFIVASKAVVFMIEQHRFQKNLISDLQEQNVELASAKIERDIVIKHLRYLDK